MSTDMLVLLQLGLNMSARETAAIDNLVTRTIPEAPAEAISPAQKLLISTITLTDMGCLFYYTEEKKLFFFYFIVLLFVSFCFSFILQKC